MVANGSSGRGAALDLHEIREGPAFPSLTVERMETRCDAIAFGTAVLGAAFFAS
jgi:hypothetical protein